MVALAMVVWLLTDGMGPDMPGAIRFLPTVECNLRQRTLRLYRYCNVRGGTEDREPHSKTLKQLVPLRVVKQNCGRIAGGSNDHGKPVCQGTPGIPLHFEKMGCQR